MFGFIKLLLGVVVLAVFVWFGANVQLGSRTLFQHLQAIGRNHETRDFLEGTRESAKPLVDGVRRKLGGVEVSNQTTSSAKSSVDGAAPPADEIPPADRQRLRKILVPGHPSPR